jgi:hypothetical protein
MALADFGRGLRVLRPHFLALENHVHRAAGRRRSLLHEHVDAGGVPVFQPEGFHGFRDSGQILAADQDIDVFRQAPGIQLGFFHIKIRRQPAHNPVFEASCTERFFHPCRETEKILQPFLEKSIDEE